MILKNSLVLYILFYISTVTQVEAGLDPGKDLFIPHSLNILSMGTAVTRLGDSELNRANAKLMQIEKYLHKFFIFEPVGMDIRRCSLPNSSVKDGRITVCLEMLDYLHAQLQDKTKVRDVVLFVLFHEFSHVLLHAWKYPMYDNEEVADDFAAALMILIGKQNNLSSVIEFFSTRPNVSELTIRYFGDVRHPLSVQRARNVSRRLTQANFMARWMSFLLPHMQSAVLKQLVEKPPGWVDLVKVKKILSDRHPSLIE